MRTQYVIGIVVALIVAVLGYLFLLKTHTLEEEVVYETHDQSGQAIVAKAATVEIVYTDDGFVPDTVDITVGNTVRWVNKSGTGMWVASAIHPTHIVYPEKSPSDCLGSSFDACEAVPNGGTYSFAFNEAGTWSYHNHISARDKGVVNVTQ